MMNFDKKTKLFGVQLSILMLLDVVLTVIGLNMGATEMNPVMKSVVTSPWVFLAAKAIATIIIILIVVFLHQTQPKMAKTGMRVWIGIMVLVVLNNSIQLASASTVVLANNSETLSSDVVKTYTSSNVNGVGNIDESTLYFFNTGYDTISSIVINADGSGTNFWSGGSASTPFHCTAGATCTGTASWSNSTLKFYWFFNPGMVVTSSPITIVYDTDIIGNGVGQARPGAGDSSTDTQPTSNNPACFKTASAASCYWGTTTPGTGIQYQSFVSSTYTFSYDIRYDNITQVFNGTIFKPAVKTSKTGIKNNSGVYYSIEPSFNANSVSVANQLCDGLFFNITTSAGLNGALTFTTQAGACTSTIPPTPNNPCSNSLNGICMAWEFDNYELGNTGNLTWIKTSPFLATDTIRIFDTVNTEVATINNPSDTGFYKLNFGRTGTFKAEYRRKFLLGVESVLNTALTTVNENQPSYILINQTVVVGQATNITFKYGFAPVFPKVLIVNETTGDLTTSAFLGNCVSGGISCGISKNVEYQFPIIIPQSGLNRVILTDSFGGFAAQALTTAVFNGSTPTTLITQSNISMDKDFYAWGEDAVVKFAIDNTNYSNKQVFIDSYNWDFQIQKDMQYDLAQTGSFIQHISYPPKEFFPAPFAFSGLHSLRLVGRNDTGTYILAHFNFTISEVDGRGYGLNIISDDLNNICSGDSVGIKVTVPTRSYLKIRSRTETLQNYTINQSQTITYPFSLPGDYFIVLEEVNGDVVRSIPIHIKSDCAPPPCTDCGTWKPTKETMDNSCSYWDGWVRLFGGVQGVNDITRLQFSLTIISVFMLIALLVSRGSASTAIMIGLFPYAYFLFLTFSTPCGQYMPGWTAIVLIIIMGIKMRFFQ